MGEGEGGGGGGKQDDSRMIVARGKHAHARSRTCKHACPLGGSGDMLPPPPPQENFRLLLTQSGTFCLIPVTKHKYQFQDFWGGNCGWGGKIPGPPLCRKLCSLSEMVFEIHKEDRTGGVLR